MPSLTALHTFEAAARLGSFKAAAEELYVTPTAVSHQIRALESQLGVSLFVRHARAISLTETGEQLARAVNQAFQQIMLVLEEVPDAETVLTVTTTPAFAALWLVPRIINFQARHPDVHVQLDTRTQPVDLERDRRIDIAIRYGPGAYPDLHSVRLSGEYFAAYAAPDYIASLSDLSEAVLIGPAWQQHGLTEVTWSSWFMQAGIDTGPRAGQIRQFDQEHHVVHAGIAGQGLILASSVLVEEMISRDLLEPYQIDVRLEGMAYTALCRSDVASLDKTQKFLTWLGEETA